MMGIPIGLSGNEWSVMEKQLASNDKNSNSCLIAKKGGVSKVTSSSYVNHHRTAVELIEEGARNLKRLSTEDKDLFCKLLV